MKSASFEYIRANTIAEVCAALASDDNARIIAGGQTLVPMMAMRLARPSLLIDIAHIDELKNIYVFKTEMAIGATTPQVVAEHSTDVLTYLPLLAKALPWIGHAATRNRGTIGGSIANADPSAEIPLIAVTLEAEFDLATMADGEEEVVEAAEFFIGPMLTTIPDAACLRQARFPIWEEIRVGTGFQEISARRSDFAFASAAAQIALSEDGSCIRAALGIGGVSDIPEKVDVSSLLGTVPTIKKLRECAAEATAELEPFDDLHASGTYRLRAAKELAFRALSEALSEVNVGHGGESQ